MMAGVFFMGTGISLFSLAVMGNAPGCSMGMALTDLTGISFTIMCFVVNCFWFVGQVIWGRELIGAGTLFNWVLIGWFTDLWTAWIQDLVTIPEAFIGRLAVMGIGILVLSFASALYQTAALGVSPYDSISMIMARRLPIPYFWCRIMTDLFCTVVTFFCGGIIGLGTLVCALGLGPFITFFTRTVAVKLCDMPDPTLRQE